jgi:HK97 family phage major capsid protein
MTIQEMKAKYQGIVETASTANRSLTAAETQELDTLKAQIADAEKAVKTADEARSAAAARFDSKAANPKTMNEHYRSIGKGSAEVGTNEAINDVVRVFEEQSPIFKAHNAKQPRLTGEAYKYPKVVPGGAGYSKTEGNAGTADTASAITMVDQTFKTYSSQVVAVSQEMLDDAGFDVQAEITTMGMAKSTSAFDADAITAIETYDSTPTETAATTWALSDVVAAYFDLPNRHQGAGVKYIGNAATIKSIVSLLTTDNAPQAAIINLKPENIIIDSNVTAGLLLVTNLDRALAIGMKNKVRVLILEVSAGKTIEVQPRLAVGLRDGTAVAGRKLKAA